MLAVEERTGKQSFKLTMSSAVLRATAALVRPAIEDVYGAGVAHGQVACDFLLSGLRFGVSFG